MAGYLAGDVDEWIYIDVDDQHPDSMRFIRDCENVIGKRITVLKSDYGCVENAIRAAGVIKMPSGFAPCTNWLKKRVRKEWEIENLKSGPITYVWGLDCNEGARAERLAEGMPRFGHEFPLIEKQISKEDAHFILESLGIRRPKMYDLGYRNNNCVGCVKGGMGYWNKIRKDFPEVFRARARMERDIGHSILKECYLDELEEGRGINDGGIVPECDLFCMVQGF